MTPVHRTEFTGADEAELATLFASLVEGIASVDVSST
jgi:hypothetical protein